MDDEAAIERIRGGDRDAFEGLVRRYQGAIFAIAGSRGLAQEAEDVTQDVFLRAYRALPDFEPGRGRFSSWLYGIARNLCVDRLRKRRDAPLPAERSDGGEAQAPVSSGSDLARRLDQALAALPPEQRIAFELVEIHGLSLDQAAEIEDVAVGTIKSRRHRARATLRTLLQPEMEA